MQAKIIIKPYEDGYDVTIETPNYSIKQAVHGTTPFDIHCRIFSFLACHLAQWLQREPLPRGEE